MRAQMNDGSIFQQRFAIKERNKKPLQIPVFSFQLQHWWVFFCPVNPPKLDLFRGFWTKLHFFCKIICFFLQVSTCYIYVFFGSKHLYNKNHCTRDRIFFPLSVATTMSESAIEQISGQMMNFV